MIRPHCRVVLPLLAAYLLATQLAWMAHDHHHSHRFGTCCSRPAGTTKPHDHDVAGLAGDDHHHHGHCHSHRHRSAVDHACCDMPNGGCGHESRHPDQPCPLHDDQCGACQFLALAQLTSPPSELLQQSGEVQVLHAVAPPLVVSRIATSHPARGPPAAV